MFQITKRSSIQRLIALTLALFLCVTVIPVYAANVEFGVRYSETDDEAIEITPISQIATLVKCKAGTKSVQLNHICNSGFAIILDYSQSVYSIDPMDLMGNGSPANNASCYSNGWWSLDLENHFSTGLSSISGESFYNSTATYYGAVVWDENGDFVCRIIFQVGGTDESPIPTDGLETAINDAKALDASNYYTSDDRYNAKFDKTSTNGFWNDLQTEILSAEAIKENPKSEDEVSDATDALSEAVANLIPIGQINPTNLYETIERCKKSNDDLKGYNDKTVNAYRTALTEANAYLDALFQKDAETGKVEPTTENLSLIHI